MRVIEAPSPNHDSRGETAVDMVVLHYTGMETGAAALEKMRDPAAKVSAHYLVEEDGRVFRLVEEGRRAWHAGLANWAGACDVNARSVGVEIVNPGHEWGYRPFPDAQIAAVTELLRAICVSHHVPPARVVGHSDVAPERKQDPGELFPWAVLDAEGLAFGPPAALGDDPGYARALDALSAIGYGFEPHAPVAAILAFQRRFSPRSLNGALDAATRRAVCAVAARIEAAQEA